MKRISRKDKRVTLIYSDGSRTTCSKSYGAIQVMKGIAKELPPGTDEKQLSNSNAQSKGSLFDWLRIPQVMKVKGKIFSLNHLN